MSKIKKLIALTLALAMVLSVSAFAGYSADTYADADKINEDCEDAVELLYALDIMVGDGKNFNPESAVTRAEMAKMIYVILNYGDDDKAVSYTGGKFFSDVANGAWYEGYVNYAAATKLVQGRPDGTFGPNDAVTCAEAAKMLLTAIGYSAEARGYTGANWDKNVLSDASIIGLLDGYKANTNGMAPRQWVAVMFQNALLDAYTFGTMAPTFSGLLTSGYNYDEEDLETMGEKYYDLVDITRVAIATYDASILGDKKANSGRVLFQKGDDTDNQIQIKNTGLGVADLGQEYRIIYNADDMKAYSVRSVSAVAEARTLDIEVDVKYGTSSNKANNKYVFTIGDMSATLDGDEDYYNTNDGAKVNVLYSGINEDASDKYEVVTVAQLEDIMTSDARNNDQWKAIDTDADGDIDFFYVTEYDYAYVESDGNHNKYGDYITAYDLNSDKDLEFNGETRLYIEDCIITEDEIVEDNIVKYTWSLDDGQYVMEVLPLAEEVEYTGRDSADKIYELGGEDYMVADEAEPGIEANVLKKGNLGESVDFVCDGDLIVWAALTDSNYTDIADVNAQLALVLDVWDEYSGGTIRNQPAIEYMTIDGETHVAAYQEDVDGVALKDLAALADAQTTAKRDNDKDDVTYTVENRLFIIHEGTKNRVWLEEIEDETANEQLDASTSLLNGFDEYDRTTLESTSTTVKLGDDKVAAEHSFFYGYFNGYGEAVYKVITTEELLNSEAANTYAQVLTLDNTKGTRTTAVAGYIFTPDLDGNTDDGYLFVDEVLRQIDEDYERMNVTFLDGTTDEINVWKITGDLIEGALYTYGYNVVDDDYTLTIVEVDDTDNEIIDMDEDYIIFKDDVLTDVDELELGDEIDNVAHVTVAVTRDQNRDDDIVEDDYEGEFDFYNYEITDYGFVELDDVNYDMIVDAEEVDGDLQYTDFYYDASEDVFYVITWVCMDRYTGENLNDSPLAFLDNYAEAALKAAQAEAYEALDLFLEQVMPTEGADLIAADEGVKAAIKAIEDAIANAANADEAAKAFAYDADAEGEKFTSALDENGNQLKFAVINAIEAAQANIITLTITGGTYTDNLGATWTIESEEVILSKDEAYEITLTCDKLPEGATLSIARNISAKIDGTPMLTTVEAGSEAPITITLPAGTTSFELLTVFQ